MKKQFLCLLISLFTMPLLADGYKNPVLPGFYPDPSVCRVNDDYYLVTSSFEYFPGVPVFHSKDLVHWQQIGHCLTRNSQLDLEGAAASGGIYAPTIRYHEGRFYMVTTNVTGKGNFYVYADDPAGEWSDPIWVEQGGIDPTLFFDNGKCYFLSIPDGIQVCEIDIQTGKRLSESKILWRGSGGRYPEAPHLYRKDGWYYLLIAEGGTEYGHTVTIARSRTLEGPYEENPANPILTHIGMNAQSNPIQGVGHADLIQAHDGSWWTVFLGFRPQSGFHHLLGRETFLAPVTWPENGWPVINGNGTVELEMNGPTLPLVPTKKQPEKDEFNNKTVGFEWNYLRNPVLENYSLTARAGHLRLIPATAQLDDLASPTFLGRRQQHIRFRAVTAMEYNLRQSGDEAGITVYMNNKSHYDLCVKNTDGKNTLQVKYRLGNMLHIEKEIPVSAKKVYLQIEGDNDYYTFFFSTDNKTFTPVAKMDTRYLSTETAGGFTGIYIGLYTTAAGSQTLSYADFDWFEYKENQRIEN